MSRPAEKAARDHWYCIGAVPELAGAACPGRLLGEDILAVGAPGSIAVGSAGRPLPVRERYGMIWTSLGEPDCDIVDIPEADEPDRRAVPCGAVTVNASGLRIVENFLDMAHFPYVHTGILGAEPNTEVRHCTAEIPTRADASSVAYRRWLKEKGITYGTVERAG